MKKIGVIGGDLRNRYLTDMFKNAGYEVYTYGLEEEKMSFNDILMYCEYIVSSTPLSRDNCTIEAPLSNKKILLQDLFTALTKEKIFFAGSIKENVKHFFQTSKIQYYDFLEDERTTILNIIPTVEGAIELAIQQTNFTLFGSEILILGYGRIGKYLSKILKAFGAKVSVAARKDSDLSWISLDGNQPVSYSKLNSKLPMMDIIFNTVPVLLLKEEEIRSLKKSCQIIDLSSKPGGVDFESAKKHGIKAELALGLPGKVAPQSAAKYMFEFFEKCTK